MDCWATPSVEVAVLLWTLWLRKLSLAILRLAGESPRQVVLETARLCNQDDVQRATMIQRWTLNYLVYLSVILRENAPFQSISTEVIGVVLGNKLQVLMRV
jgi:hypothetical protein